MVKIYEVWQNADSIEGRGPMYKVGTYSRRDVALSVAEGLPRDMGGGALYDIREDWMFETLDEIPAVRRRQLLEGIKKRLSKDEWEALVKEGLKYD
jgi:hypothetical protein